MGFEEPRWTSETVDLSHSSKTIFIQKDKQLLCNKDEVRGDGIRHGGTGTVRVSSVLLCTSSVMPLAEVVAAELSKVPAITATLSRSALRRRRRRGGGGGYPHRFPRSRTHRSLGTLFDH